jgi:hypothetical protein
MNETALSRLERSLYQSYWNDGLLDLWAGLGVLGIGLAWTVGWIVVAPAVPILLIVLWPAARRRWVEPRVGAVSLSRPRRRKERLKLVWSLQVGWPVLVLVLLGCWSAAVGRWAPSQAMAPAIPLVILAAIAFGASLMLALPRFSAYSATMLLVGLAGVVVQWEPGPLIMVGGAVITAAGAARLTLFVRRKPVMEQDDA